MKQIYLQTLILVVTLQTRNVAGQESCTVGHLAEPQSPLNIANGEIFLDMDNPVPCSGFITAWHFCHHMPASQEIATGILQLWRPIAGSDTYERVYDLSLNVDIPSQSEEAFMCDDHELQESDYIPVQENDVLAVYKPRLNGLRMVSTGSPNNALYIIDPGPDVRSFYELMKSSTRRRNRLELHLMADINRSINQVSNESTMIVTTPPNNLNMTGDNQETPENDLPGGNQEVSDRGLPAGGVAAIVIILLIIVGATIVVTVILVILWYKKRKRGFSWDKRTIKKSNDISYDNAVYEETRVRANSSMANYLNSTVTGSTTPYEVPISTRDNSGSAPLQRKEGAESMYVAMDGASVQKQQDSGFISSLENYTNSQPNGEAPTLMRESAAAVFDIYQSFGPKSEAYCQFIEETVSQNGTLPPGIVGYFDPYADPPSNEEDIHKTLFDKTRTITYNEIEIMEEIGSGEFAFVNRALWLERTGANLTVAVKSLHSPASEEERLKFLQEAAIMGQFIHPNVVRLIGVVKTGDEISLVIEYCAKGNLSTVLKDMKSVREQLQQDIPRNLLSYSQQIALAMHYLSSKGFIHRDLAARNVFVTQENICKLGDFGMSRDLADAEYYLSQGGVIPVRWTAPEAIYYRKYSTASDIWSYGCLLFEIWSLGTKPFQGQSNTEVLEIIKTGYRLSPPPGCPRTIYSIMIQCWNPETGLRPAFRDILVSTLMDDAELLHIPKEDAASHTQATQLGATLEAGKGMYQFLQYTYLTKSPLYKKNRTNTEQLTTDSISSSPKRKPLTPQSSSSSQAPPLLSTPIPKSPLTPKSSVFSPGSQQPHSSTPPPGSRKPPVAKKPSFASVTSSSTPNAMSSLSKSFISVTAGFKEMPMYGNADELYDDATSVLSSKMNASAGVTNYTEDIYEDIINTPANSDVPQTSEYEVHTADDSDHNYYDNPQDRDYEDI